MKKLMANGRWKLENILYYLLILLLPTQLGKHFWPDFAYVLGIRVDYLSPTIYLTDIMAGLLLASLTLRKWSNGQMVKWSKKAIKPYSHLAIFAFASFCYLLLVIGLSDRIGPGLYNLLKIFEMAFVAYYTTRFVVGKDVLRKVITLLGIGVIAESVLSIAQYFHQGSIGGLLYFLGERTFNAGTPGIANASINGELILRPYGTLPHPNVLAGYLVVAMTLILFSLQSRKTKKESGIRNLELWKRKILIHNSLFIIRIIALAFGTAALFLSMSRVASVLWVLILIYLLATKVFSSSSERSEVDLSAGRQGSNNLTIKQFNNKLGSRQARTIALLGFVALISLTRLSPISSRFTNINIADESIMQRSVLIDSSVVMIKSHPLFGVGLGNFLPALAKMQKPLITSTYLQPVHNIFLLVAAETGLIGLSIFLWFLWNTLRKVRSQKSEVRSCLVIIFSVILIIGLFDHYWLTLQQGQLLFAFVLGLCWRKS